MWPPGPACFTQGESIWRERREAMACSTCCCLPLDAILNGEVDLMIGTPDNDQKNISHRPNRAEPTRARAWPSPRCSELHLPRARAPAKVSRAPPKLARAPRPKNSRAPPKLAQAPRRKNPLPATATHSRAARRAKWPRHLLSCQQVHITQSEKYNRPASPTLTQITCCKTFDERPRDGAALVSCADRSRRDASSCTCSTTA